MSSVRLVISVGDECRRKRAAAEEEEEEEEEEEREEEEREEREMDGMAVVVWERACVTMGVCRGNA